jgi:hypothetical protein
MQLLLDARRTFERVFTLFSVDTFASSSACVSGRWSIVKQTETSAIAFDAFTIVYISKLVIAFNINT